MVLGHHSLTGHRSAGSNGKNEEPEEDETVVDTEQGNVLSHIISQLRPGADLNKVTLPTFILEPRSMLERITNFMAHPETLLPMSTIDDTTQRFISVVKFYLSGWHIRPPGVKKPLNPILGEIFTGYWDYPDGTKGYYISEQTSHHPPKSSYFFMAPHHNIRIDGTLKPHSKFLGNSAGSMMEGIAVMRFLNRPNERYFVTQPNMYARGILFGKMKYELGDHSYVRCPENNLVADIEFKTRGYFSGSYNAIGGFIRDMSADRNLYEISGFWNGEMFIKDLTTGQRELLFDATHAKEQYPLARPLEEQDDRESQKLWRPVTEALKAKDHNTATEEKSRIENMQREEASQRASKGVEWHPRLFRRTQGGLGGSEEGEEDLNWIINAKVDGKDADEKIKQILNIAPILPGQKSDNRFEIPKSRGSSSLKSSAEKPSEMQQEWNGAQGHETSMGKEPDELIDFGQNEEPSKEVQPQDKVQTDYKNSTEAAPPVQMPLLQQQHDLLGGDFDHQMSGYNNGTSTLQPSLEPTLRPQSQSKPHMDIKLSGSIRRLDSSSNAVDEFHDALG